MAVGYRVLLSAPYMIPEYERFRAYFERAGIEVVVAEVRERMEESELLEFAGTVDGVICGDDRFSREVIQQASPRLKVIAKWGTGVDSIDLQAAQEFGVRVSNTPGAFTDAVADTVMGYILVFARRLPWMDRQVKDGLWEKQPATSLGEAVLGVVGVGRIGKAVLRRAQPFGMRLLGNDVVEMPREFVEGIGVRMLGLEELLSQSDFVSLNCDLNPTSQGLIDARRLAVMRHGAVLINTARGPVVDESALIDALRSERLGGAALDVFEQEPLPADSPLREMNNVLLAPHNANSSREAWEHVHWSTLANLFDGLGLEPPRSPTASSAPADPGSGGDPS